jgi:DUF4097 and DUF4098 domain-containing protein YvlB
MKYLRMFGICAVVALVANAVAIAQEPQGDRVTVPFSDVSRPRRVVASLLNGGFTVKGYDGKEVIIEARSRSGGNRRRPANTEGLRRIDNYATGLTVEESENTITIGASHGGTSDITIQVPRDTSLKLNCTNSGKIVVEGVNGEIDVNNLNGSVQLTNVSGVVVAHSLNGGVIVSLDRVTPGKEMSFSSFNGDVDVTLPPDIKANIKMKSENGEIYSDFEVALKGTGSQPITEGTGRGKRLRFDKAMYGTINGGGPELQFTTFNGRIYIRKKK